ncbi:MAG: MATE family efflux transporter [Spirochaetales bacterium]|nr:MATE family efflux transporter [Spirochaetales bacterium]
MAVSIHSNKIDMLNGSIWNKLIIFSFPIILSSLMQQLFNSADIAVVGRFAGSHALAAVGSTGAIVSLLINLFVGFSIGANVIIARCIGEENYSRVQKAIPTAYTIALIGGFSLIFLGWFLAYPMLEIINTPEEVLPLAALYLRIYFCGMPFFMVYNTGSAILRSNGDTKRPLYALFLAGILNVILNLVFVIVFRMSVAGVALATVISNSVSAVLVTVFLVREEGMMHLDLRALRIHRNELKDIVIIGLPAGLQGAIFSFANASIQSGINSFGTQAIAGSATSNNFNVLSYFTVAGFNQATMTFVSQNFGAGKYDRVKCVFRDAMLLAFVSAGTLSLSFWVFRYPLLGIFTADPEVIEMAIIKMIYMELPHCMIALYEITGSTLRGIGKSMLPTVLMVFGTCIFRVCWVLFVVPVHHTLHMLYVVYPLSWILTSALVIPALFIEEKKIFSAHATGVKY